MTDQPDELQALLAGMADEFLRAAADRVAAISTYASGLAVSADPTASLSLLIREAHTLKGGGATFGFPSLGEVGARVELLAKELAASGSVHSGHERLQGAIAELRAVLAGLQRA
jgi:HPt (histidine-containing phosphotransfer) domain-containing protein